MAKGNNQKQAQVSDRGIDANLGQLNFDNRVQHFSRTLSNKFATLRDTLLQTLLSGELRVSRLHS